MLLRKSSAPLLRLRRATADAPANDESGQVLVLGLLVVVGLTMIAVTVANVGMMVSEKIQLQDSVDAAAYSSAVVEARYMNLIAYLNRAMVANYNSMAFNTAVWSVTDAFDHGSAVITDIMYKISAILLVSVVASAYAPTVDNVADILRDYVHHPLHLINKEVDNLFAQDNLDLNQYIEITNTDILSTYQGLLYAALQSTRYNVAQEVARRVDPDVVTSSVLGVGGEMVSYDELAKAVDFVTRDPDSHPVGIVGAFQSAFKDMSIGEAGTTTDEKTDDHPLLLAATTEASLDKFAAGKDRNGNNDLLRQFNVGNIIPADGAIEFLLDVACEVTSLGFADCDADLDLVLGAAMRDKQENGAFENHVPFIARQRMREVEFFGLELRLDDVSLFGIPVGDALSYFLGPQGHTSGDQFNDVLNVANVMYGIGEEIDFERALQCILAGCQPGYPIPKGLNAMNIAAAYLMLPITGVDAEPFFVDDHWDGTYDTEPVHSWEVIPPIVGEIDPPVYLGEIIANGVEDGVPKYDWRVDLDNVGFFNYHYDEDDSPYRIAGNSRGSHKIAGPSVAVVGVKSSGKVHSIRGLGKSFLYPAGLGNGYDLTAMSRAQVYYLHDPNRPDEKPSMFNPHWVARLAPINSDDTPPLLKEGLPFIASVGVPLIPTH